MAWENLRISKNYPDLCPGPNPGQVSTVWGSWTLLSAPRSHIQYPLQEEPQPG